jgi:serine/threonine-protein kinase
MIHFQVLGSTELRGPEGNEVLSVLAQPKRTALLSYLAVASPRGFHRRDKLAALFWPEVDQDHARASLRKTLHFLRKSMGEDAILTRGDEEIGLAWEDFACDAVEFREKLEVGDLEGALELYRGDVLEGFFLPGCSEFERWMEAERERFRRMAADAAWAVAHRFLEAGRITDGERMGQRALSLVGTDENEARRFLEELARAGDRAAAVRFYDQFAQGLRNFLGLEPSAETQAAVKRIRGVVGPVSPPKAPDQRVSDSDSRMSSEAAEAADTPTQLQDDAADPSAPDHDLEFLIREELAPGLELLRKIGSGGGSEVYLGRQKSLDRLVAVKVLSRELSRDRVAKIRFEREAKAAASLDHPNAVTVHRFGWLAEEVPFLVMQYVGGPTLEEKLSAEGPLSIPDARGVLAQVAAALAEAHRKGFVHRDVSQANVLWDRETDRVLLTDFGLAGLLPKKEGALPRVTQTGDVLGDPGYLSPEQIRGEDPSEGTDVYALGILAYEILTGGGPFPTKTVREAATAHLRWTPRPLVGLRVDVDEELADLLKRCLAKEPGKRPSAEFLAETLAGEAAKQPEGTRAEDEDILKALSRRRLPWILAVAGLIGLGCVYVVDILVDRGPLPEVVFRLTLNTFLCGLAAIGIVAWFHGEKGHQKATAFEVVLLAVVCLVWLAIGVFILLPP